MVNGDNSIAEAGKNKPAKSNSLAIIIIFILIIASIAVGGYFLFKNIQKNEFNICLNETLNVTGSIIMRCGALNGSESAMTFLISECMEQNVNTNESTCREFVLNDLQLFSEYSSQYNDCINEIKNDMACIEFITVNPSPFLEDCINANLGNKDRQSCLATIYSGFAELSKDKRFCHKLPLEFKENCEARAK